MICPAKRHATCPALKSGSEIAQGKFEESSRRFAAASRFALVPTSRRQTLGVRQVRVLLACDNWTATLHRCLFPGSSPKTSTNAHKRPICPAARCVFDPQAPRRASPSPRPSKRRSVAASRPKPSPTPVRMKSGTPMPPMPNAMPIGAVSTPAKPGSGRDR